MFLNSLKGVAEIAENPLSDDTRRALETALRYFREAAPKHTADEEESLFPRLRQRDNADLKLALERLEPLEDDHRRALPLHDEVDRLGQQCLQQGALSHDEAERMREAIAILIAMYREHIDVEDRLVFPLATQMLSEAEKQALGKEMAARRQVLSS
jgi:hemerythrin-like domain-containing protein